MLESHERLGLPARRRQLALSLNVQVANWSNCEINNIQPYRLSFELPLFNVGGCLSVRLMSTRFDRGVLLNNSLLKPELIS